MRSVPTEADWKNRSGCSDGRCAYENFNGISLEEAIKLFEQCALTYQEDLYYMPQKCFEFYIQAYTDFILSDESEFDSDGASCYINVVSNLKQEVEALSEDRRVGISQALRRISESQNWFDASEEIYGSFARRIAKIKHISPA